MCDGLLTTALLAFCSEPTSSVTTAMIERLGREPGLCEGEPHTQLRHSHTNELEVVCSVHPELRVGDIVDIDWE